MTNPSHLLRVFPNDPVPPFVDKAEGLYVFTHDGRRILDLSGGGTSFAILGWHHPAVTEAIISQAHRFGHMDYKLWSDQNLEDLASLLVSRAEHGLDRVYFAGNSGAEACEAAMKMSYQVHHDLGRREKHWFISREQSYHGSTADALALGERPNLEFYRPMLSPFRARVPMHHPLYRQREDESLDDYARRSAGELEAKIIEIGPEKVCGFVGETIMGGLVGDVPPAPNYWRYVKDVCDKYEVHLILDEVYCGTGTSGKVYCCDYDHVRPDFIFIGKTLAAGYGALSAVITSSAIEAVVRDVQGRLQHTTTHQGHSLSAAAALAVQRVVHDDAFLNHVNAMGAYMRETLIAEFGNEDFFRDVRGRGLRFSFEYQVDRPNDFGNELSRNLFDKRGILINAKWHRVSFTPGLIITREQADSALGACVDEIRKLIKSWK